MSQSVCAETKENETAKSTDHSGGKIKNEKECAVAGRLNAAYNGSPEVKHHMKQDRLINTAAFFTDVT